MHSALELADSRIDRIVAAGDEVMVHFSHAYVHRSKGHAGRDPGTGWSQEAVLTLHDAPAPDSMPGLPDTIVDGSLEMGGIRYELIPLPFKRKVGARLHVLLAHGGEITLSGERPIIELLGKAIFLEPFS
jgi:hypothetical protein